MTLPLSRSRLLKLQPLPFDDFKACAFCVLPEAQVVSNHFSRDCIPGLMGKPLRVFFEPFN